MSNRVADLNRPHDNNCDSVFFSFVFLFFGEDNDNIINDNVVVVWFRENCHCVRDADKETLQEEQQQQHQHHQQ